LNTGDLKQYPLLGTNLILYKNGVLEDVYAILNTQFQIASLPVNEVFQTIDNKLKINMSGRVSIIDLSIL
jgi:hypothetical protein